MRFRPTWVKTARSESLERPPSGTRSMGVVMFNGPVFDVAIGMFLLFFVASLLASAVVEAIGGFLHRRQKHLWDSLDLLLGNTSIADDVAVRRIVNDVYQQPFITGLVRPSDRPAFEPVNDDVRKANDAALAAKETKKLPLQVKTRATKLERKRRRYGPTAIPAKEFANALLGALRPGGTLDTARSALSALQTAAGTGTDVPLADVAAALDNLAAAGRELGALNLQGAIDGLEAAGASIPIAQYRSALQSIKTDLDRLTSGPLTQDELLAAVGALPDDLQKKLTSVLVSAGNTAADIRTGIEEWFDRNMEAASGWYRKQTRWFLFIAGFAIAGVMNIDAVQAATTLYRDEDTRAAVLVAAEQVGDANCPATATSTTTPTSTAIAPDSTSPADTTSTTVVIDTGSRATTTTVASDAAAPDQIPDIDCLREVVGDSIPLPIGWGDDNTPGGLPLRVVGWFLVAIAVTMGAPFWFDLLRRALNIRRDQKAPA